MTPVEQQALLIIEVDNVQHFADLMNRRFTEVRRPSVSVPFDTMTGLKLCRKTGVVTCPRCFTAQHLPGAAANPDWLATCLRCRRPYKVRYALYHDLHYRAGR